MQGAIQVLCFTFLPLLTGFTTVGSLGNEMAADGLKKPHDVA